MVNGTGQASINATGLVTAITNGTVTARATANDGTGIFGTLVITITNQTIPVTGITVTGAGGSSQITSDNGTLQLTATVSPTNATNQTVTWSVVNGTGQASINATGLVTATSTGLVTVRAITNDGGGVFGELVITIANLNINVTQIVVSGEGGVSTIRINDGTLQLSAAIFPANATNKTVTWSLVSGKFNAEVNSTGLVTALRNGKVRIRATAQDGSRIFGEITITITRQKVPIRTISIRSANKSDFITSVNGLLPLIAEISPINATDQSVNWLIIGGSGQATINEKGVVTAISEGTVIIRATANDGSEVYGDYEINIAFIRIPRNIHELRILVPEPLIPSKVSLYNYHGGIIGTRSAVGGECVFDTSMLPSGIYFVVVHNPLFGSYQNSYN